jgi:acetyl esterase/lipase
MIPERYKELYRSRQQNDGKSGLSKKHTSMFQDAVEPDLNSGVWSPLIWETGHKHLPRTYFQVCGADLQRDDSLIYERVLRLECGIKTKVDMYAGLPHVFWYFWPGHSVCKRYYEDTVRGFGWLLAE